MTGGTAASWRLVPPRPARETLVRSRLLETLRERWTRRVVSVVAGAGFGKTTVLTQAIAENSRTPMGEDIWVACGPEDSAASVLAAVIAEGLDAPAPSRAAPAHLAESLAAALAVRAPVPVTLVLDDVHVVDDGSSGAQLLAELVQRLPTNGHLVLSGRRSPDVPLARLVSQGRAVRLQEDDLAFTADELGAFARLRDVPLDALSSAGRWPAIAELSATAGELIVADYLWQEVLGALPEDRRRHLAILAAVGSADRAMLEAAAGEDVDAAALVADLPLATVRGDHVGLHALWTEPLGMILTPGDRRDALLRAAAHASTTGDRGAAVGLLIRADEWDRALGVMVQLTSHAYPAERLDVIERWLTQLPADRSESAGALQLRGMLTRVRDEDPAAALPLIKKAEEAFREAGDVDAEIAALANHFNVGVALRSSDIQAEVLFRAVELAEAHPEHRQVGALSALGQAIVTRYFGDVEESIRQFEAVPPDALDPEWQLMLALNHAEAHIDLGQPEPAVRLLEQTRYDRVDPIGGPRRETLTAASNSAARLDDAVRTAEDSVLGGWFPDDSRYAAGLQASAVRHHAFRGDIDAVVRFKRLLDSHGPSTEPVMRNRIAMARAAAAVLAGDEDEAAALLRAEELIAWGARRVVGLVYVLLPETRADWDAEVLGPAFTAGRALAQAFVALRERGDTDPVRQLGPVDAERLRVTLPVPWATHLAVGAIAVGHEDGPAALQALGPAARPWIESLRDSDVPAVAKTAKRLLADVPATPDHVLEVRLLGASQLRCEGEALDAPEWRRERVRQLFAWLSLHPRATREAAATALWPDLDPEAGANNLRATLSHLLKALQPGRRPQEASYYVRQEGSALVLAGRDRLVVDAWELDRLVDEGRDAETTGALSTALESYRAAAERWRGPYLADAPAEWAHQESERLRLRHVHATVRAAELSLALDRLDDAAAMADAALVAEPWSEAAHRVLVSVHLERGDRAGARRALERCHAMLRDELGVEPEAATRMLDERLRTV